MAEICNADLVSDDYDRIGEVVIEWSCESLHCSHREAVTKDLSLHLKHNLNVWSEWPFQQLTDITALSPTSTCSVADHC
jgi:hypothetical protein